MCKYNGLISTALDLNDAAQYNGALRDAARKRNELICNIVAFNKFGTEIKFYFLSFNTKDSKHFRNTFFKISSDIRFKTVTPFNDWDKIVKFDYQRVIELIITNKANISRNG